MTSSRPGVPVDTWPFWAPSQESAVEAALDLAGVGPGDRVCDLGCGDGQVLLAAARRGAVVSGIEADPDLVIEAKDNLAAEGIDAEVVQGDLLDPGLEVEADVFFAYLAPATLQRLVPVLSGHAGCRVVTVDFDIPGLIPARRGERSQLYRLPGRRRRVPPAGWPTPGSLVAAEPGCQSLTCLDAVHPGGPVTARLSQDFHGVATILSGSDELASRAHLAVDLRWDEMEPGVAVWGWIEVSGLDPHGLVVVVTDEDHGVWELTDTALTNVSHFISGEGGKVAFGDVLDATAV